MDFQYIGFALHRAVKKRACLWGQSVYNTGSGGPESELQPPPRHLSVALTPQNQYRDSSSQGKDDFYQYLDHRMILLSASIGEPGPNRAFLCEASGGTRFSNFHGKKPDCN
ncbi:hypothetical protein SBA4_2460016 [Candidatus Sulfopaludibacter sp. SbA4]|nr:hypothetical protein SBA4_2460016 [Candidatus Sulfopaludibacter sp. SbA4]